MNIVNTTLVKTLADLITGYNLQKEGINYIDIRNLETYIVSQGVSYDEIHQYLKIHEGLENPDPKNLANVIQETTYERMIVEVRTKLLEKERGVELVGYDSAEFSLNSANQVILNRVEVDMDCIMAVFEEQMREHFEILE